MLTVLQKNYQLEYSASYTGNVHGETTVEGYQYCISLKRTFESLISEQYSSLILTVDCIAFGIVNCANNRHLKRLTLTREIFMVRVILKGRAYY